MTRSRDLTWDVQLQGLKSSLIVWLASCIASTQWRKERPSSKQAREGGRWEGWQMESSGKHECGAVSSCCCATCEPWYCVACCRWLCAGWSNGRWNSWKAFIYKRWNQYPVYYCTTGKACQIFLQATTSLISWLTCCSLNRYWSTSCCPAGMHE